MSGTIDTLFQDALIHAQNRAQAYTTYLTLASVNRDYPDSHLPLTRRKICLFYAVDPDPMLQNIAHVLECEFAAQQTMPVWAISQFVKGERDREVLNILRTFTANMIVNPFRPAPLEDIWGALKFVVIDICGASEGRLIELCSWMNQQTGGRLLSKTQGDLDLEFQALRLGAFSRETVALGNTVYKISQILGSRAARGRKFLTCVARPEHSQKSVVLRFGAHPISCPLAQDPQMALRYAQELNRGCDYAWVYPPVLANKLIGGVSISDLLFALDFERWKDKPLTFSQEALARKVGRFFSRCRDNGKMPRSPEDFKKLGVKPSGEDGAKFWQTAPIAMCPFTWDTCEKMKRALSGEGIILFQLMSQDLKVDEEANWDLSRRVREIGSSLIKTGTPPPLLKDDDELYIAQLNKISDVTLALKKYDEKVVGKLIGHWLNYTNVTLIDAWDRLESDIEGLLIAQENHDYPLSHDLTPLLHQIKVVQGKAFEPPPSSPSKYLGEWVKSFSRLFEEE